VDLVLLSQQIVEENQDSESYIKRRFIVLTLYPCEASGC
jgi:hypothetical protein